MTSLIHQSIVRKLNRRRALAPLWEMVLIFLCVFSLAGLLASIGYACADLSAHEERATDADSRALVWCMNGSRISLGDGYVMHCSIKKVRM